MAEPCTRIPVCLNCWFMHKRQIKPLNLWSLVASPKSFVVPWTCRTPTYPEVSCNNLPPVRGFNSLILSRSWWHTTGLWYHILVYNTGPESHALMSDPLVPSSYPVIPWHPVETIVLLWCSREHISYLYWLVSFTPCYPLKHWDVCFRNVHLDCFRRGPTSRCGQV